MGSDSSYGLWLWAMVCGLWVVEVMGRVVGQRLWARCLVYGVG